MECNHCGLCCKDPCTQINITIGDIWRISSHLKMPVEELFKEHISINPFGDPDLIHYELDLGLNIPCKFRVDERCSIYPARPLNCRLFPYWILAEAPYEKLTEILEEHRCSYDTLRKKDYKEYKDIIGQILLEESRLFEIKKKVNVTRLKGFNEINEQDFREREQAKIKLIKQWNKEKPDIMLIKQLIEKNLEKIKQNTAKIDKAKDIVN